MYLECWTRKNEVTAISTAVSAGLEMHAGTTAPQLQHTAHPALHEGGATADSWVCAVDNWGLSDFISRIVHVV